MSDNPNHDPNPNPDLSPDPNRTLPVVPALQAMGALDDIGAVLGNVDISDIRRGSVIPLLLYKARENLFTLGAERIVPEPGVRWLVDIRTFARGYVAFVNNKPHERMAPTKMPSIDPGLLPDVGNKWEPQWAVHLACLDGANSGQEFHFKANTVGGTQALSELYDEVRARYHAKD